jgi:hypothetical protein
MKLQNFRTGQYLSELPQWLFQVSRDDHFFEMFEQVNPDRWFCDICNLKDWYAPEK